MIEEIREKLLAEVEALNHELHVILPETLKKAIEHGDLRENADYQAALERQGVIGARLEHLRSRLHKLSDIKLDELPTDRVALGSKVTVTDLDTNEVEIYEIVIPDATEIEDGHVSVSSPLGRALMDKKKGEVAYVDLPFGTRELKISDLETWHDLLAKDVGKAKAKG